MRPFGVWRRAVTQARLCPLVAGGRHHPGTGAYHVRGNGALLGKRCASYFARLVAIGGVY